MPPLFAPNQLRQGAGHQPQRYLWPLVLLVALTAYPAGASLTPSQPALDHQVFIPTVTVTGYTYLPVVMQVHELELDIIANPSFENEQWFTDSFGNQHPAGWTFHAPTLGQPLPFPTKQQDGQTIPAVSGGQGEYVHKYFWQLPYDEWVGAPRGLILEGLLTYKVFSDHIPHALRLSQTISYTPGRWVKVTGYILGETQIFRCSGSGVLEDDHFIGSVRLGDVADTRLYSVMHQRFELPNNERAWNKFSVTAEVPASGQLPLVVIAQSNWGCPVDFFMDHFQAFVVAQP